MQVASQITECDCGTLFDGMLLRDGSGFEAARHTVLRLELELDFVLARALAERCGVTGKLPASEGELGANCRS